MNIKFSIILSLLITAVATSSPAIDAPTIIEEGTPVVFDGIKQVLSLGQAIRYDMDGNIATWYKVIPKPIPFLTVFKNRLTNHPILIMGDLACVSGIALLLTKKALTPRSTTEIEEQQQKLFLFAQE